MPAAFPARDPELSSRGRLARGQEDGRGGCKVPAWIPACAGMTEEGRACLRAGFIFRAFLSIFVPAKTHCNAEGVPYLQPRVASEASYPGNGVTSRSFGTLKGFCN